MSDTNSASISDSFEQPPPPKPKPVVKPVVKPTLPQRPQPMSQPASRLGGPSSGLDWLEQSMVQRRASDAQAKKAQEEQAKQQQEQLEKMKQLDNKRSRQMYEEIQQQIQLIRKKRAMVPTKNITGAAGYDPQQHQDPETFWDKVKKKKEEAKKKLPWSSKQGMGTGEITRGVAG